MRSQPIVYIDYITVGGRCKEGERKKTPVGAWEKTFVTDANMGLKSTRSSDIIVDEKNETAVNDVKTIGKINIEKYQCVTEDIQTDEVIITDERVQHIKERHPNDYEQYFKYAKEILAEPDYILEANKPHTAFILKHILDNGKSYQMVLRLKTSSDPKEYKNSIITFLKIDDKRYKRYLRTKKILYKSE